MSRWCRIVSAVVALGLLAAAPVTTVGAGLTLTAAGKAQGFGLSTFATGFPTTGGIGPLGMAFPGGGNVLVTDFLGNTRVLKDTDNQTVPAPTHSYGYPNAISLAQDGGTIYMTQRGNDAVVTVDGQGKILGTVVSGIPGVNLTDIVVDSANHHLFVSSFSGSPGIVEINPFTRTYATFLSAGADGLTITPDGKTLYAEVGGHILGFDTSTKAQVFDSGGIAGGPDGTALGAGSLAGLLFVNTNAGTVVEIDMAEKTQTVIATGGSRGDFTKVDPYNDTLLLTQTDSIVRLIAPPGGGFVVPEPSSLILAGSATLAGLAYAAIRRSLRRRGREWASEPKR